MISEQLTPEQENELAASSAEQDQRQAENLLDTSKIMEQINDLKNAADGWINPLAAYVALKRISERAAAMMSEVKDWAISEAEKQGQKEFEAFGAKVAIRNSAGKWDFSGVAQWNTAKEKLKSVEELAKSAHSNKKHGVQIFDEATGEVIEPAEYTEGATNIFITLKG